MAGYELDVRVEGGWLWLDRNSYALARAGRVGERPCFLTVPGRHDKSGWLVGCGFFGFLFLMLAVVAILAHVGVPGAAALVIAGVLSAAFLVMLIVSYARSWIPPRRVEWYEVAVGLADGGWLALPLADDAAGQELAAAIRGGAAGRAVSFARSVQFVDVAGEQEAIDRERQNRERSAQVAVALLGGVRDGMHGTAQGAIRSARDFGKPYPPE